MPTDTRIYLTEKGIARYLDAVAKQQNIEITHMVIDSVLLPDKDDPKKVEFITPAHHPFPAHVKRVNNTLIMVGDIPVGVGGFQVNGVAFVLADNTIFAYARGFGDHKSKTDPLRIKFEVSSFNSDNVTNNYDASALFVTHQELIEHSQAHKGEADPHIQYLQKAHAATASEIDAKASSLLKYINLSMLWRALFRSLGDAKAYTDTVALNKLNKTEKAESAKTADRLGGLDKTDFLRSDKDRGTPVAIRYRTAGRGVSGIKIRLPVNTNAEKMLSFTVRVYQSYRHYDVKFSGYLYPTTNQWRHPDITMITGSDSITAKMGRDSDGCSYVWLAGGDHTGVAVIDVVAGYNGHDYNNGWEIKITDICPNVALTKNVHPPYSPNNKPTAVDVEAIPVTDRPRIIQEAKNYTNTKFNHLLGSGADALTDTIGELAQLFKSNKSILTAVQQAIGNKLDKTDKAESAKTSDLLENRTKDQIVAEAKKGDKWIIPTLLNGLTRTNIESGLRWRYIDPDTIQVIGIVYASTISDGATTCFIFPSSVATRINKIISSPATAEASTTSSPTVDVISSVDASGSFKISGYRMNRWCVVNQTIPLS